MNDSNEQLIRDVVERVLGQVKSGWGGRVPPQAGSSAAPPLTTQAALAPRGGNRFGQFTDVSEAVAAAGAAQKQLMKRSLAQRKIACDLIRRICIDQADRLGQMEFDETKIGRLEHKSDKLAVAGRATLGIEFLRSEVFSGDHGLTVQEFAPFGVIGAVTPVTHSLPTTANNSIAMISAGNAVVFNPHPGGKNIAAYGVKLFNQAIYEKIGIDNLIAVMVEPTLESAKELFGHPGVNLLAITGGPGVVSAALHSGKRAICAGPGNPPVVVDASADIENAARCIIEGAAYDNNLLCLAEKEIFVEAAVYEKFTAAMRSLTAFELSAQQMNALADKCLEVPAKGHAHARREWVGKGAVELGAAIGVNVPRGTELLFGPTSAEHPWVRVEQMMSAIPVVKAQDFEQAVVMAKQAEHGFKHTSILHSRLVDHMTHMGKEMDTALFIKNGPSVAGNGGGGEGYGSYSIACSTGEGICTPLTYTRTRRCTMVDNLRII